MACLVCRNAGIPQSFVLGPLSFIFTHTCCITVYDTSVHYLGHLTEWHIKCISGLTVNSFTFCLVLVLVREMAGSRLGDQLHVRCCIHLKTNHNILKKCALLRWADMAMGTRIVPCIWTIFNSTNRNLSWLFTFASYPLTVSVFSLLQPNIPVLFLQREMWHMFLKYRHAHSQKPHASQWQKAAVRPLQMFTFQLKGFFSSERMTEFPGFQLFHLQQVWHFGCVHTG